MRLSDCEPFALCKVWYVGAAWSERSESLPFASWPAVKTRFFARAKGIVFPPKDREVLGPSVRTVVEIVAMSARGGVWSDSMPLGGDGRATGPNPGVPVPAVPVSKPASVRHPRPSEG